MQKSRTARHQAGFTLIELMITVSVAAILMGIGIPAMSSMVENNRRTQVVNDLVGGLHLARNTAQATGEPIGLCPLAAAGAATCTPGSGWQNGWLVFRDSNADGVHGTDEEVLRRAGALPRGISLSSSNASLLRYRRNRGVSGNTTFTICPDSDGTGNGRAIAVGVAGFPRLTTVNCP